MTTTDDPDVFRRRWTEHINELERLKFSLPPEHFDDVDEAKEILEEKIGIAADNFEEDDE